MLHLFKFLTQHRYYLIQLLQDDGNTELFHVFKRWGRVGYSGGAARQSIDQFDSAEEGPSYCFVSDQANPMSAAIEAFCHTFESKTNNDWEEISRGVEFVRF